MPARAFGRRPRSAATSVATPVAAAVPLPGPARVHTPPPPPPAPEPVLARRRIATPTADSAIADVVARIHPTIIKSLDMSKIADLDNETLATQLLAFLESGEADAADLSPLDRQRVVTQLVHDIKGLGPIEPLLHDPEISDILINGVNSLLRGAPRPAGADGRALPRRPAPGAHRAAHRGSDRAPHRRVEPDGRCAPARRLAGQHHHSAARPRRGRDLDPALRDARVEPRRHGRAPGALARDGGAAPHRGEGPAQHPHQRPAPGRARPRS